MGDAERDSGIHVFAETGDARVLALLSHFAQEVSGLLFALSLDGYYGYECIHNSTQSMIEKSEKKRRKRFQTLWIS